MPDERDEVDRERAERHAAEREDLSSYPPRKIVILGLPAIVVAIIAVLLGIPWWIVLIVLAIFGLMIITNS
jgi:hypothetical protein